MGSLLFTIVSFIVALSILIAVHEFGHFWVARKLGVKVLKFSIGFGRPILRRKGKVDGTEYVLAAIPLGGYVKMLDEREEEVPEAELSRAFNRQSLSVRSAIVVAGPLFNFLFAIFAYWLVFMSGDTGLRPWVGEVEPQSIAATAGFIEGDEIVSVGDRKTQTWESVAYSLIAESLVDQDLAIGIRDEYGAPQTRLIEAEKLAGLSEDGKILSNLGLTPKRPVVPPVIGEIVAGEAADKAGLMTGDHLLSVDGQALDNWGDWVSYIQSHPQQTLALILIRDGQKIDVMITPASIERGGKTIGRIGAGVTMPEGLYEKYRVEVKQGPVDAMQSALSKTWDISSLTLTVMGKMLTGQLSVDNLSGPISIADSAGKSASYGLTHFIKFLAIVSISLGILNLLPVPILDGGHLLFFLIEAVKGSPVSEEAQVWGQKLGMALLLGLMSLAFYVDVNRLLG